MLKAIQDISTIIERDSKDTTYKFALLRACIQISQDYEHFAIKDKDLVTFPLGLIVLKWIEYYYPIFEEDRFVPQKNGDTPQRSLAFRNNFINVIELFKNGLGYYQLQKSLKNENFDRNQVKQINILVKSISATIVNMPMKYIGSSLGKRGEIFLYNKDSSFSRNNLDMISDKYIINSCGSFSIPKKYHDAFFLLGSFINGTNTILSKWVDFTLHADKNKVFKKSEIFEMLEPAYNKDRDVAEIKIYLERIKKESGLNCIWSGQKITNDLNIDHLIPYSVWKNNDLWNLLPTKSIINNKKSDKIPSLELLNKRKDLIINYWELILREYPLRLKKEIQLSLLGNVPFDERNWQNSSFKSLTNKCVYLISQRGYEPFTII